MKITTIAAAFLALVTLAPSTWAEESTGTISTSGPYAEADIYYVDGSGVTHEVYLFSSTITNKVPGGPPVGSPVTYAYYFIYNGSTLFDAGFGFINGTLAVEKNLSSASLTASGTLSSFFSSAKQTVNINLTWTESGPAIYESDNFHLTIGTEKFVMKFDGTFVPATLGGTATLNGVGLTKLFFADFGSTKASSLTID